MAMVIFIFHRLKSLFLMIIGVWRRALCCFRRKRRPSRDDLLLEGVDVITCDQNGVPTSSNKGAGDYGTDLRSWNTWDDYGMQTSATNPKPNTMQEHIELYRQQAAAARTKDQIEEPAPDFFQDMTPRITEQTKVFIRTQQEQQAAANATHRLSLEPQPIDSITDKRLGDLGEWEDQTGWEEEAVSEWDIDSALKEKRRLEREKRHQRRQHRLSGGPPGEFKKLSV